MIKIDTRGELCPIPVVKTKSALKSMKENEVVETLVDNNIAVENLEKMAKALKYNFSYSEIENGDFAVFISKEKLDINKISDDKDRLDNKIHNNLVVIDSNIMGNGNEELGRILLKGFIYALTESSILPKNIVLYNSGVKVACEDSESIEDLKKLENLGVKVLSCGLCIDYFNLKNSLKVGEITNMYNIVELMGSSSKIIKP